MQYRQSNPRFSMYSTEELQQRLAAKAAEVEALQAEIARRNAVAASVEQQVKKPASGTSKHSM